MAYFDEHPVVAGARNLRPLLLGLRGEAERAAQAHPQALAAMGQAGMFRLMAPLEVEGLELSYPQILASIEEISVGDISASWYVVNSTMIWLRSAFMAPDDRARLRGAGARHSSFSGLPVGTAIAAENGYRLSGQWPLVTGCEGSQWSLLSGKVDSDDTGRPDIRFFFVETERLEILGGWDRVAGMRGTGSNAVRAQDIVVDKGLAQPAAAPLVLDRPLFRIPLLVHAAATADAAVLGAWRSGFESIRPAIASYRSAVDGSSPGDDEYNQELVGRSDAVYRAARAGFALAADEMWRAVESGEQVSIDLRAQMFATVTYTIDTAREEISRLYAASSRATFERNHEAEQALRNIHAFSNPIDRFRRLAVDAGRVMLDRQPRSPMF